MESAGFCKRKVTIASHFSQTQYIPTFLFEQFEGKQACHVQPLFSLNFHLILCRDVDSDYYNYKKQHWQDVLTGMRAYRELNVL